MTKTSITVFWFRNDLRLDDNTALYQSLKRHKNVQPIFIFDKNILNKLDKEDNRLVFIHKELLKINEELKKNGCSLLVKVGYPVDVFHDISEHYDIKAIFANKDYEPDTMKRDSELASWANARGIAFFLYKDAVIFEKDEVLKNDGTPYTVYTPYSKKWLSQLQQENLHHYNIISLCHHFYKKTEHHIPSPHEIGFSKRDMVFPEMVLDESIIRNYAELRDFPAANGTSKLGLHLRFGTLSIRKAVAFALKHSQTWLNELIWREFFKMILYHYPHVEHKPFKSSYADIEWSDDPAAFELWCAGQTGYPIVDAGMRELVQTGYMHNRVRMITAGFLVKHLLIDWRKGEAFFAKYLLDYDLSSNNGNWQWAAGTGCDAAPYFRVFNPITQAIKFDKEMRYIEKWVPEIRTEAYPMPIIEHHFARKRVLALFQKKFSK